MATRSLKDMTDDELNELIKRYGANRVSPHAAKKERVVQSRKAQGTHVDIGAGLD